LTEVGIGELKKQTYPAIDLCFSSPMKRCIETAQVIYPDFSPVIIDELREIDFGDFENKNHSELDGNPEYQAWIDSGGKLPFPNGENMTDYGKMVMEGIAKLKEIALSKNAKTVAAVVHGGTIMAVTMALGLSDYFDGIVKNGETKVIRI